MNSVILRFVVSLFTYFSPVTTVLLTLLVTYYIAFKWRRRRMEDLLNKLPGPLALPIIGNALEISTGYDGKIAIVYRVPPTVRKPICLIMPKNYRRKGDKTKILILKSKIPVHTTEKKANLFKSTIRIRCFAIHYLSSVSQFIACVCM